jgi:hypothetical protein
LLRDSYFATGNDVVTLEAVAAEATRLADGPFAEVPDVAELAGLARQVTDL